MSLSNEMQLLQFMSDEVRHPQPIDYILPGFPVGTIGAIVSPGGHGKSMLSLQIATQLSAGQTISDPLNLGNLKQRLVTYLPAEDPREIVAHRMNSVAKHYELHELLEADKHLMIIPVVGRKPDLFNGEWLEWLEKLASVTDLIILDTLRRWHNADENNAGAMAQLLSTLENLSQKYRTSFIFLHHTSKATALGGQSDTQQASRGSSVLVDNIRWQLNLVGMTEQEAEIYGVCDRKRYVRLVHSKSNYGAPMPDKWLERQEGGLLKHVVFEKNGGGKDAKKAFK